jgi:hypothetical protein
MAEEMGGLALALLGVVAIGGIAVQVGVLLLAVRVADRAAKTESQ